MKISEFRALIKEEVRKVLKESKTTRRTLRETYMDDNNMYLDEFDQLDPATLKKLDALVKASDEATVASDRIYDLVSDIMGPDSFDHLYGWIEFYEEVSTKLKSKAPKLAKAADAILSIIKPLDK